MFNLVKFLGGLRKSQRASTRKPQRAQPKVEVLEDRCCPAGVWDWVGPVLVNTAWSNPAGGAWNHDGVAAPANDYPGMGGPSATSSASTTYSRATPLSTSPLTPSRASSSRTGPCTR